MTFHTKKKYIWYDENEFINNFQIIFQLVLFLSIAAYVEEMEVNVIVVDWRKLSLHSYPISRKNMWVVARKVAMMIEFLWQLVPKNSVHVIGHSLGAHVAGISGEVVRGGRIHRITGK